MGAPIIPAGLWAALRFAHNPAPLSPWPVASLGPLPAHRGPSLRSGHSRLTVARRFARAPPGSPWPVASLGPLPAHSGPSLRSGHWLASLADFTRSDSPCRVQKEDQDVVAGVAEHEGPHGALPPEEPDEGDADAADYEDGYWAGVEVLGRPHQQGNDDGGSGPAGLFHAGDAVAAVHRLFTDAGGGGDGEGGERETDADLGFVCVGHGVE